MVQSAAVNWFTAVARSLHHFRINSFSLDLEFKPELPILSDQALNFAFTKFYKMAIRADNYIFPEILRLTNTSRRREVKERVDPLRKYDDSEFHTRFRLSKLTVHLLSDVCQTVHLTSFRNITRSVYCENHGKSLQL